jgi:hypothetical protein
MVRVAGRIAAALSLSSLPLSTSLAESDRRSLVAAELNTLSGGSTS